MDERALREGPPGVHVSHALGLDLCGLVLDDRYEILRRVGSGGMAAVYEGRRKGLERRVAVKILRPELAENESNIRRFLREARSAASVEHPNVVSIEDVGGASRPVYFVMEFLEGVDLRVALRAQGRFEWPRTRELTLQIAGALAAAHARGIVHRDVKPANCFLVREPGRPEYIKVLDFGIAKVLEESQDYTHNLTATHGIVGTVAYMAPEQAKSSTVDPRTDVYALGTMLYEMLAGTVPFPDKNPFVVIGRLLGESPMPLRMHRPDLSPEIEALVMTCLEKEPDLRFQSMDALRGALLSCDRNDAVLGTAKVEVPTGPSANVIVSRFVTQTPEPSQPGRSGNTTPMRAQSGGTPITTPSSSSMRRPTPTTPIAPTPRRAAASPSPSPSPSARPSARETDAPQPRARSSTSASKSTRKSTRASSSAARTRTSDAAMLGVVFGGLGMIALGGTATWWALYGSKAAARAEAGQAAPIEPGAAAGMGAQPAAPVLAPVVVPGPATPIPTPIPQPIPDAMDAIEPADAALTDPGGSEPSRARTRRNRNTTSAGVPEPEPAPEPTRARDPDPPPERAPDRPEPSISPDLRNPFSLKKG